MTDFTGQNWSTNECSCDCSVFSPIIIIFFFDLGYRVHCPLGAMFYFRLINIYNSVVKNVLNKIVLTFVLSLAQSHKITYFLN